MTEEFHTPVLLNEAIDNLKIQNNCWYIDATAGGGGHLQRIMEEGGLVLAIDQDTDAIKYLENKYTKAIKSKKLIVTEGNFADLKSIIKGYGITGVMGVLFDLGMSTYQIKYSGKGFSFKRNEALDMRMSGKTKISARDIINNSSESELYDIFRFFGEENLAGKLAQIILFARSLKPISTTFELADIVEKVYREEHVRSKINPGTKIFQALRIAVNRELINLKKGLEDAVCVLNNQGRCAVICFHSLEDRIVKQFFNKQAEEKKGICINRKPITANEREITINPAARSAKMRVFEKRYDRI